MTHTLQGVIRSLLFFITIAALFCQGCTKRETPSYSGPPTKMVIGIYRGELTTVLYMAEQLGYLKQMGIDAELRDFESGAAAVAALNDGRVDLATGADFVFAANIGKHPDLRMVAAINSANSIYLVARRDRGILKPADLKGKRVAVTLTTPGEYFLGKQLSYLRLKQDDVTMVNMTPTTAEKEMAAGSVDAAIFWNPVARRIRESLGANGVSWSAQSESPFHMLLISRDSFIKKEAPAMLRLMKALIMAEKAIEADPAAAKRHIARRIGMPESYLAEVWGDNRFRTSLDRSLILALEEQSRWIARSPGADNRRLPNYLDYIHFGALESVDPGSVTIIH
ncbi:MAG: NrtA/SsuA/CpmA family ABC transporter substrate-binding protein [Geobacteraceae bacterium]|nr:NrtA/SsuA/CpmA family ABC transporter substrate-binding protein [Geobacteraceae bacterium]